MNGTLHAHRIETTLTENGTLTLEHLPFRAGDRVEVIVLPNSPAAPPDVFQDRVPQDRYPLRGTPYEYRDPLEPVAQSDWEAPA